MLVESKIIQNSLFGYIDAIIVGIDVCQALSPVYDDGFQFFASAF